MELSRCPLAPRDSRQADREVKKGKIWVSEIIYETPIDYGWDPKKATVEPPEDLTAEKISEKIKESAATKEEKPPAIPTTNLEQEKIKSAERIKLAEIEAETKRQKNKEKVASAERLFEKGKITLEQYIDL